MKHSEVLHRAVEIFSQPGTWTQNAYARDQNGSDQVLPEDENAVCWCSLGILHKLSNTACALEIPIAANFLRKSVGTTNLFAWNDAPWRTQDEIVSAFRAAERIAKSEGQ